MRALTQVTVAVAQRDQINREVLAELSTGHRREDALSRMGEGEGQFPDVRQ